MTNDIIRCSALPRVMACPASKHAPDIEIDESSELANIGTAVHAVMAEIVRCELDGMPENFDTLIGDEADPDECRKLAWNGLYLWQQFRDDAMVLHVEEELAADIVKGHPDVVFKTGDGRLVALDWKTGYIQKSYDDQLLGYLYLADFNASQGTELEGYVSITGWIRWHGQWDVTQYQQSDIVDWKRRLESAIESDTYAPGEHCTYCPMFHECAALARRTSSTIAKIIGEDLPATPEALGRAYESWKQAMSVLRKYDALLKQTVERDGMVPLPDGSKLVYDEQVQHPLKASMDTVDIISGKIGSGVWDAVAISKSGVDRAVKNAVPKGQGAKVMREIMASLDEKALIEERVVRKLSVRKGE